MTLAQIKGRPTTHRAVLVDSCPYCGNYLVTCRVPGCDRESRARGLCKAHYGRLMRLGSVGAAVPLRRSVTPLDARKIQRLVAGGLSRRAVARQLGINRETVRVIAKAGAA